MPNGMLSPTTQRITSFPYTPVGKPKLSEYLAKEDSQTADSDIKVVNSESVAPKVIIKEFAKENNDEKKVDIEQIVTEVFDNTCDSKNCDENYNDCEVNENLSMDIEEPVSPPPSEPNEIIIVDDDEGSPSDVAQMEENVNITGPSTLQRTLSSCSSPPPPTPSPAPSSTSTTPPPASPEPGQVVATLIRALLENTTDLGIVRWEEKEKGEFKVTNPVLLAKQIQRTGLARCDRGVFESVPGKPLVFKFGTNSSLGSAQSHPETFPSSTTEEDVKPIQTDITQSRQSSTSPLPPPPPPPSKRKTYAQKIFDLQKPIPGQTSQLSSEPTSPSPMLLQVVPQEVGMTPLTLRIPSPSSSSSMPALIPLTVANMSKKNSVSTTTGLHLSGGRVSTDPSVSPFSSLTPHTPDSRFSDIPKLDVFRTILSKADQPEMTSKIFYKDPNFTEESQDVELPLDLSGKATKRKADIPLGLLEEGKKMKIDTNLEVKRKLHNSEANKKYKMAKARRSSTEQEMEELWTFCRALLHNPDYNPRVICWESIEDGEFRIINQEEFLKSWEEVKKTKLLKDVFKRRIKACEEVNTMHSRPHTRLGYRFGSMSRDWRPKEGELVDQGRRMVPSRIGWNTSRFRHEFQVVKQEVKVCETPLFTLTPLPELPQQTTVNIDEETTTSDNVEDMTECDEFECRLILPRHRGYHAKLRLGDGLTITLDRAVFAQIEERVKQALKPSVSDKGIKTRITYKDKMIANAVIRKGKRRHKARTAKKLPPAEKVMDAGSEGEKMRVDEHCSTPVIGEDTEMLEKVEEEKIEADIKEEEVIDVMKNDEDTNREENEAEIERTVDESSSSTEARHRLPSVVTQRIPSVPTSRPVLKMVSKSPETTTSPSSMIHT